MKIKPLLDAKVRRIAIKNGYKAVKCRTHSLQRNELGGYALVDPANNTAIHGANYCLTPEDVFRILGE